MRIDRLKIFLDSMGGGAWPFLVGGVICLVNSVNERDLSLLTSNAYPLSQLPSGYVRAFAPSGASARTKLTESQCRLTG